MEGVTLEGRVGSRIPQGVKGMCIGLDLPFPRLDNSKLCDCKISRANYALLTVYTRFASRLHFVVVMLEMQRRHVMPFVSFRGRYPRGRERPASATR